MPRSLLAQRGTGGARSLIESAAAGFFTGNAGVAVALALVARRNARQELLPHVRLRLEAAANPSSEYDLFSGSAGVIWAACMISLMLKEEWPIKIVNETAQSLVQAAAIHDQVLVWPPSEALKEDTSGPFLGAAHGSAGIAMALAIWGRVTGNERFGKLSLDTFRNLYQRGLDENGKTLLYRLNSDRQASAIANWCHGTAGYLWCLLQAFGDDPALATELDWAVRMLAEMPRVLAINPTYCHGLSGLLELWRMVSNIPRYRAIASDRGAIITATLRLMSVRSNSTICWCSDDPTIVTPDLWIGFLAPATALALYSINYSGALLSYQWLEQCASH